MMTHRLVAIIDDDKNFAESLSLEFSDFGFKTMVYNSLKELFEAKPYSLTHAVVDLRIRHENGLEAVQFLKDEFPTCQIVVLTGYGSIATAVDSIKYGAKEYISKPASFDQILKCFDFLQDDSGDEESAQDSHQHQSLAKHEREYIEYVLNRCKGNVTKAADWLGIHRQSLQRKLKKFPPN